MSIEVLYIPGAGQGRRLNEAFSVITRGNDNRRAELLDILPLAEYPGITAEDVEDAFVKAVSNRAHNTKDAIRADARARLTGPQPA